MLISRRPGSRAGRSGPSATTSPGSSPTRAVSCGPSIPRRVFFGVAPGTSSKDQSETRCSPWRAIRSSPTPRSRPTAEFWWEGMTDTPAGRVYRLAGPPLDPPAIAKKDRAAKGCPSQRPFHRPGPRSVRSSIPIGRSPRACRSAPLSSAGRRAHYDAAGVPGFQLEAAGVYTGATMGFGDHRRRGRPGGQKFVATRWAHAAVSAAITWADYFPALDQDAAVAHHHPAHFPRPTGSARMPTATSSGPASARTCGCWKWDCRSCARSRPGQGNAHRVDAPAMKTWNGKGLDFPAGEVRRAAGPLTAPPGGHEVIGHEELFIDLHDHLPKEMVYERETAHLPPLAIHGAEGPTPSASTSAWEGLSRPPPRSRGLRCG